MKKNQLPQKSAKLRFAFMTITLCIGIIIACKNNVEDISSEAQAIKSSYLKFDGKNLDHVNANFRKIKKDDGYEKEFNILMTSITSSNMDIILSKLKTNFKIKENFDKANLVIIYLKNDALSNVSLDEVAGVSIWQSLGNGINSHKLYRLNSNNILELDPTYSVNTGKLINRDINYLSISVLKNNPNINWVAYSTTNENYSTSSLEKPYIQDFTHVVINNSDVILTQATVMGCSTDGCPGAGGSCNPLGGCDSLIPNPGGGCLLTNLDINSKGRISSKLNLDIARDIRDNYMSKSTVGNRYINYYEKISQIVNSLDTRTTDKSLTDYMTMYNDLVSIIETLKEGSSADIVLDIEKKGRFLEMIEYYRPISKNKEFQTILNQIEIDLKNISEKPRKDVLNIIQ